MLDFTKIENLEFSYFDENGYIYTFNIFKNKKKILANGELETFMICNETNITANSEVFFLLKQENNQLSFRSDYFANSNEYTKLNLDTSKSTTASLVYSIAFNKDTLELKLTIN